jgi:hypothetical protein
VATGIAIFCALLDDQLERPAAGPLECLDERADLGVAHLFRILRAVPSALRAFP